MSTPPRRYSQSRDELIEHLHAHQGHLERSAAAFDDGHEHEAARLATSIRVLVHDRGTSSSLLAQLGVQNGLHYVDTSLSHAGLSANHPGWDAGLASMEIMPGRGGRYVALLDKVPDDRRRPPVPFGMWWNKKIYRRVGLSRQDLVLALANTDGGAHVDPRLKDSYADLARRNSLGWEYADSEGLHSTFEGNAARASVRQIAFELLETLQTQLSSRGDLVAPHTAGRNDPCPCGSGVKFKNCCGR